MRFHTLTISIFLAAATVWSVVPALAQVPSGKQKLEAAAPVPFGARAAVEALVGRNPVPGLAGLHGCDPIFAKDYDWGEYGRVWMAFQTLIDHAEDAWHEMVGHLDDSRYAITVNSGLSCDYAYNWTVGDACFRIVQNTLTEAHFRHLHPSSSHAYNQLRYPDFTRRGKTLKAWCEARGNKKLYELQIEVCQWAISQLGKEDFDDEEVTRHWASWAAAVQSEIASLRRSQKAVHFHGFGEGVRTYTRAKADQLRKEHRAANGRDAAK
jgi:hypothetical protein